MTIPRPARLWLVGSVVVAAIILAFVATWNHAHGRIADLQRSLEAEHLAREGEVVAHQQTKADLAKVVAQKLAADADLAAAAAKLKLLQPDAQVVSAATLSTGAVVVDADPDEETVLHAKEKPPSLIGRSGFSVTETSGSPAGAGQSANPSGRPGSAPTDVAQASAPTQPASPESTCVLHNNDTASITVNELTFKTQAGNYVPVGTATAWREGPGPRAKLFSHAFEAALSDASELAMPRLPRWGAGAQGVCFATGCAAGPGIAFPPVRFTLFGHGFEIDANATAFVGPLGAGLGGGAFARF